MDQQKTEIGDSQPQEQHRAEKRLARGLEDVSHLFLSQAGEQTAAKGESRGDPAGQDRLRSAKRAVPTVLNPSPALSRDQLASLLQKNVAALEDGLRTIDAAIPCDIAGPIDLLAVDATNQLAILELDSFENNDLLVRGICHFDWLVRNIPIVRRMYQGQVINFSSQPRIFLIAPSFSQTLRCAAIRITCPQILCYRYQTVTLPNGSGILFERA